MTNLQVKLSPYCNARPQQTDIDLIILHAISLPAGTFESIHIHDLFLGKLDIRQHPSFHSLQALEVSAHFLVDRRGDITQFVPVQKRAWHAGQSCWQGRANCNDYAIGIEMIGDEEQAFTAVQYRETARLCKTLMNQIPLIQRERIVGHQDVSPGRKWDPGLKWDWQRFYRSLAHIRRFDIGFC
ncbi:MAG: 1,6-anhydro-N-acetylmuramyl-L-alanine amidase AmpD [Mariprofundaceae bacterium]